jgi:hypothetical protein
MREHGRPAQVTANQSKAYMELREALCAMKRARWRYSTATYLNVYEVHQCYGGREEGGWWFDAGSPVASVPIAGLNRAEIDALEANIRRQYQLDSSGQYALKNNPEADDFDISRARGRTSCAGGYDVEVRFEDHFAEALPASKPRYE